MKKASEVFKSIRFAKLDPHHDKGPKGSTDDEQHYTVGEKEFQQQIAHVKKRAMQEEKKDEYDEGEYDQEGDMAKSDLRSIIANAKRMHDMIEDSDNLPEWVQSKITKAEDYISTVANYMEAEMNEEVEQIDEISSDLVKKARDVAFQKGKDDQGHRLVRKAYQKGQKESEAMAKKINEVSNALLQRYKEKAGKQIDNPATPSATKLKRGVGHLKATSKQMTSGKPMPEEVEMQEETDFNVKVSHHTNDGKVEHKMYKIVKAKDHRHAQNIALNKHTAALDKAGTKYRGATASVVREDVEALDEKNVPTSPEKWAQAKAQAKAKFDVYPSAYANGWAAKKYKEMGGGWKSVSEEAEQIDEILRQDNAKSFVGYAAKKEKDDLPFTPDSPKKKPSAVAGKYGQGYSTARHLARQAMQKQAEKLKKVPVKEESSTKAKIVKDAMKKKKSSSEDAFQAEPVLSSTVTKTQ